VSNAITSAILNKEKIVLNITLQDRTTVLYVLRQFNS
jgi:hypothetical protein